MSYLMLIAGFAILASAGDFLVRGAVLLADRLGIPPLIIGLTIVAFGTSAPELFVSVRAVLHEAPGIAIGNVVGSNIANILLVLGLPALIKVSECSDQGVGRNVVYMLGASALFVGLCYNGPLAVGQGARLFGLLVLFLADSTRIALNNGNGPSEFEEEANELIGESQAVSKSLTLTFLLIVVGVVGLPIGAHLTVSGASQIAASLGISNAAIGLTAVALGTSLPELVTTLSCTLRGHGAMAIGNILGSNLFNILAVMGVTAMLAPVPVHEAILRIDLWVMLAAALVITPFALGKLRLTRFPAALFVLAYIAYTVFVLAPKNGL